MTDLRVLPTRHLSRDNLTAIRSLLDIAFEDGFSEDDWDHTLGGTHVLLRDGERVVAHAAVVSRDLIAGDAPLLTGYVEGVATDPQRRRQGYGTAVMHRVGAIISSDFELGALSTDMPEFYASLGWERWEGPTYMQTELGPVRTEDEDAGVMVLRTPRTEHLSLTGRLLCDQRKGDAW